MIPSFISEWEKGWKVVMAVKPESKANPFVHFLRKLYYRFLDGISEVPLVKDATGFGLYDRAVLNCVRDIHDPYPYFRGLICELGFPIKTIAFNQPRRSRGISKNNFYTLFDLAMLGIVSHSIVPIRLATMMGFFVGTLSLIVGIYYGVMKIIFWDTFPIGIAPLVIGFFFMTSTLLLFLGLMGEYIASIHTYVKNRPIVVEKERINF
jgi:dolichol-phosphate mannosyltransferase